MEFIAIRENLGREAAGHQRCMRRVIRCCINTRQSFGAAIPQFVTPEFVRSKLRAVARSFRRTSIIPNLSR